MGQSTQSTVTHWIEGLKGGEAEAVRKLWERYFEQLTDLARQHLGGASRRVADEEDVALSVFDTLCRGAARQRFTQLSNRGDLWALLLVITRQKSVDLVRRSFRKKRGAGQVAGDSVFNRQNRPSTDGEHSDPAGIEGVLGTAPTPEFIASMNEEYQRLLGLLRNDELRQVAVWRMEGFTNNEIAEKLGVTVRSIERKLNLIREKWAPRCEEEALAEEQP